MVEEPVSINGVVYTSESGAAIWRSWPFLYANDIRLIFDPYQILPVCQQKRAELSSN